MNINEFSAYDYDKQTWITGADAVTMRIKQLNDDLDLFESDKGEDYARFLKVNQVEAIKGICAELEELGAMRNASKAVAA